MKKWIIMLLLTFTIGLVGCDPSASSGSGSTSCTSGSCLKVINNSSLSVYYLYVSPCSSGTWGSDQLGSSTISPGASLLLTGIPAGCYDLLAIDSASVPWYEYSVTFTSGQTRTWNLTNSTDTISSVGSPEGVKVPDSSDMPKPLEGARINSSDLGTSTLGEVFIDRGIEKLPPNNTEYHN